MVDVPTRDQLVEEYLASLPYEPYRVQEDALLAWFTSKEGVLVCAPTGTGKTLIAQAALFEALKTGTVAYYTTPLIALTEQKFHEMQKSAVDWGFRAEDVGLVTGNRRVNPEARVLIVVAEILLNRLLDQATFDFVNVSAVVVDEFHSISDPERGIVWELTLALMPAHVRLLLLSATVGNATEFLTWLERSHRRKLELVASTDRRVPLEYHWVGDKFLGEHLEHMAEGADENRKTPALVFCFNRDECWSVAEHLKGLSLLDDSRRKTLMAELDKHDWTLGVAPKLKQMLQRGVAVHHAGLLPKYRRIVESLYERKLLAVCVCTETLAAGINLPARSVVLTTLVKGPRGKMKLIEPSTAHQIFGRAGRPQFDDRGHVYAIAHEDDVRISRWQLKYNSIPENTKDPGLLKVKKDLWRKRPTRSDNVQYWNEVQFQKLIASPPGNLAGKGNLPWRLLAHYLKRSPEIERLRSVIRKRLFDSARIEAGLRALDRMLISMHQGGFVRLDPPPPPPESKSDAPTEPKPVDAPPRAVTFGKLVDGVLTLQSAPKKSEHTEGPIYSPKTATATPEMDKLLVFRSVHPIYAAFLLDYLGVADQNERLMALESLLELPRPILRHVKPPKPEEVPPGPLLTTRVDPELIARGLMVAPSTLEEDEEDDGWDDDEEPIPPLSDKLRMLFEAIYPDIHDVRTQPIWAAGELLRFDGDFNRYVKTHDLIKQEGLIFRHLLRLVLLCAEFSTVTPTGLDPEVWKTDLRLLAERLTRTCRQVDPQSTDKLIEKAATAGETPAVAEVLESIQTDLAMPATESEAWKPAWEKTWDDLIKELAAEGERGQ